MYMSCWLPLTVATFHRSWRRFYSTGKAMDVLHVPYFGNDWDYLLKEEFGKDYYKELVKFLQNEFSSYEIYPKVTDVFNALKFTTYKDTKVVILAQDPYHGRNQAHGLAFSVNERVPAPPSLVNIFRELSTDVGCAIPNNGYLKPWADQGVLLLNTVLTVRANQANSHKNKGWENFTNKIIQLLNRKQGPVVFILWGNHAKEKQIFLNNRKHLVLKASHPSPFSADYGFFGCKHFSKANVFLKEKQIRSINWQIPNI